MIKGAQIAVDQAKGISVSIDVQDEACDPQAGVNATNKMVADKVTIVAGFYCSGATLPSVAILHRAHIPTIIAAASAAPITQGGFPEVFRVYPTGDQKAPVAVEAMMKIIKAKTVAIIHDNTASQKGGAVPARTIAEKAGGNIVLFTAITPNSSDYGVTVAQIISLKPDAVLLDVYYPDAALITKQLFAAGYPGSIVEGDCLDPHFIQIVGEDIAKRVTYVGPLITQQLSAAQLFVAAYHAKYGTDPDPYTVYQVDAINVAIDVLKQVKSDDPDKIIVALKNYDGTGTTGHIAFDASGQLRGEDAYHIMYWRDDKFVLRQ